MSKRVNPKANRADYAADQQRLSPSQPIGEIAGRHFKQDDANREERLNDENVLQNQPIFPVEQYENGHQ